jgi:hypothetical protein
LPAIPYVVVEPNSHYVNITVAMDETTFLAAQANILQRLGLVISGVINFLRLYNRGSVTFVTFLHV